MADGDEDEEEDEEKGAAVDDAGGDDDAGCGEEDAEEDDPPNRTLAPPGEVLVLAGPGIAPPWWLEPAGPSPALCPPNEPRAEIGVPAREGGRRVARS